MSVYVHLYFTEIRTFSARGRRKRAPMNALVTYKRVTRVKKRVSERVSLGIMHMIRSETLGETVGKTFRVKKSRQESRRESRIGLYA